MAAPGELSTSTPQTVTGGESGVIIDGGTLNPANNQPAGVQILGPATFDSSVSVVGNITATNLFGNISGNISNAVYADTANIANYAETSNVANLANIANAALYAVSAGSVATANTVTDNAQPNITSVGTLTYVSVSGNVDVGDTLSSNNSTSNTLVINNLLTFGAYTQSNLSSIIGNVGQVVSIVDSVPGGQLVYWNITDNCWSYVCDNSPVALRAPQIVTALGTANVSNNDPKIGNGSVIFDGSSSLTVDNANLLLNATPEKTIEFWVKDNSGGVVLYLSQGDFGNASMSTDWWQLYPIPASNKIELGIYGSAFTASPDNTYTPDGTWQNFAWTIDGDNNSWYINGNLIHTFTRTAADWSTLGNTMAIGAQNPTTQGVIGFYDEIRISSNVRYTANYTPSTVAFTDDTLTQLLLHCDGPDGSTSFPDDNS